MVLMAASFCSPFLFAQKPGKSDSAKPETSAKPSGGSVTDAADLEAFFDGVLPVQMSGNRIAGAVVAVVVGDKVVFTKGYGYADVAARRKVDPEKTMFRIASISKLFTWTAVMQLVEEGKLDVDTDVNQYLKEVKIPATFEQPITLKHLLTHTPGFEDRVVGLFGRSADDLRPLSAILNEEMPLRVRPPGVIASYSNHGTGIAGLVVADVSGMSWEDFVEKRIVKPLGMEHSLIRQPAKAKLPDDLSKGYKWEGGRFKEQDFEYVPLAPAGCISMSAGDAAKFMLTHLNDGQLGDRHILKPETARRMREPLFRHDPKTCAMCYGFWEQLRHGQRIVGHGGDTLYFHSLMQLVPERKVGLFVSYNTDTSSGQRELLWEAFLNRYFPEPDPPVLAAASDGRSRAEHLAGEYVMTRYSHSSVAKLGALMGVIRVSVNDDDTITVRMGMGGRSRRYAEAEPLVYREVDGPQRLVFHEDEESKSLYLYPADWAAVSAVKPAWYDSGPAQLGLLGASTGILTSALLFWPAIGFSVRGLTTPRIRKNWFSGLLSLTAWLLSLTSIGFIVGVVASLQDPEDIVFGLPLPLKIMLTVPQFCAVLSAATLLGCLIAWKKGYWRLTGRLHFTLVSLAGVGFTWFLYHWNLLPFGFAGIG
jgi:CubicO group peptidase (beta-lactamase class C family)